MHRPQASPDRDSWAFWMNSYRSTTRSRKRPATCFGLSPKHFSHMQPRDGPHRKACPQMRIRKAILRREDRCIQLRRHRAGFRPQVVSTRCHSRTGLKCFVGAGMTPKRKLGGIPQSTPMQITGKSHAGSFMDALSSPHRAGYSEWDSPRIAERTSGEGRHDLCKIPIGSCPRGRD
jgi:hypothetical protein